MNKANILKLAEHLDTLSCEHFDQECFAYCGSPSCVAGHAVSLSGQWLVRVNGRSLLDGEGIAVAREWLDLTFQQSNELFAAHPYGVLAENVSARDAAATLRHLAETGEVVWSHRREDPAQPTDLA